MKTARRSFPQMDLVTAEHSVRLSAFSRNRDQDTWHIEAKLPDAQPLTQLIWNRLLKLERNKYLFCLKQGRRKSQKTIVSRVRSLDWTYGGAAVSIELQRVRE